MVHPLGARIRRWFGPERGHRIVREKNIWTHRLFYKLSKRFPGLVRRLIRSWNVKSLPAGFDVDRHFKPPYGPWDQRMCTVPDGDLFRTLREGSASIMTERIESFTESGVKVCYRRRARGGRDRHGHRPGSAGVRRHAALG